jgi:hypothetical protein
MKIDGARKAEDCFDDGQSFRYWLESRLSREDIETLGQFGTLDYYPDFPRPFFRVIADNGAQIKGVQDELSFLVVYPKGQVDKVKEEFERFFCFASASAD